jgi:hypothetical protein
MNKRKWVYEVTEADIAAGVRGSDCWCVHATAIARTWPDLVRPSITTQDIRGTLNGDRLSWPTPEKVIPYILAFDAGDFSGIKPMRVDLGEPLVLRHHEKGASAMRVRDDAKPKQQKSTPTRTRIFGQRRLAGKSANK